MVRRVANANVKINLLLIIKLNSIYIYIRVNKVTIISIGTSQLKFIHF